MSITVSKYSPSGYPDEITITLGFATATYFYIALRRVQEVARSMTLNQIVEACAGLEGPRRVHDSV